MPREEAELNLLVDFKSHLHECEKSKWTIHQRIGDMNRFARLHPVLLQCNEEDILTYFSEHEAEWSDDYRRKVRSSLIAFYTWAHDLLLIPSNPSKILLATKPHRGLNAKGEVAEILQDFRRHLHQRDKSAGTIFQRIGDMHRFSRLHPALLECTEADVANYLADNQTTWSRNYRRKVRSSLIAFYTWAHESALIPINPSKNLADIRYYKGVPKPIPESAYLDVFEGGTLAERAIISLATTECLRRAEIAAIHPRHRVNDVLTIRGKGDKVRAVPLSATTAGLLLQIEEEQGKNAYYFPNRSGGHLDPSTIYKWAKRWLGPDWHLRSCRHRGATNGFRETRNIRAVQALLGHSSLATTEIYTQVTLDDLRDVVYHNQAPESSTSRHMPGVPMRNRWASEVLTVQLSNVKLSDVEAVIKAYKGNAA